MWDDIPLRFNISCVQSSSFGAYLYGELGWRNGARPLPLQQDNKWYKIPRAV